MHHLCAGPAAADLGRAYVHPPRIRPPALLLHYFCHQTRILYQGRVTHLGYYPTEEQAARVFDRVALGVHWPHAAPTTNFPAADYAAELPELASR